MTAITAAMLEKHRSDAIERVAKIEDEIRALKSQREQCKGLVSFADHLLAVMKGNPQALYDEGFPDDGKVEARAPAGAEEDAATMTAAARHEAEVSAAVERLSALGGSKDADVFDD